MVITEREIDKDVRHVPLRQRRRQRKRESGRERFLGKGTGMRTRMGNT